MLLQRWWHILIRFEIDNYFMKSSKSGTPFKRFAIKFFLTISQLFHSNQQLIPFSLSVEKRLYQIGHENSIWEEDFLVERKILEIKFERNSNHFENRNQKYEYDTIVKLNSNCGFSWELLKYLICIYFRKLYNFNSSISYDIHVRRSE